MSNILCDKSPQGIAPAASTLEPSEIGRRYDGCLNPQVGEMGFFSLQCFTGNMTVKQRRMFHGKPDGETTTRLD